MKKLLLTLSALLITAASSLALTYEDVKNQDKPIVVMFHQHGCGACRRFSPRFDQIASKFSEKFNFIKEDVKGSKIESLCSFDTVPAFFIMNPKTKATKRISDNCAWDDGCFQKALNDY